MRQKRIKPRFLSILAKLTQELRRDYKRITYPERKLWKGLRMISRE